MTRILLLAGGVVLTLAGILFTLQGLGVVSGSSMSGNGLWVVLGPIIAIAGILLFRQGRRTAAA